MDSNTLEGGLTYHLKARFYPPIPTSMVQPCAEAVIAGAQDDWGKLIKLPDGISFRGEPRATAEDIIDNHRLGDFVNMLREDN
jgi:hypothetical protein